MASRVCPECQSRISPRAIECPECGHRIAHKPKAEVLFTRKQCAGYFLVGLFLNSLTWAVAYWGDVIFLKLAFLGIFAGPLMMVLSVYGMIVPIEKPEPGKAISAAKPIVTLTLIATVIEAYALLRFMGWI